MGVALSKIGLCDGRGLQERGVSVPPRAGPRLAPAGQDSSALPGLEPWVSCPHPCAHGSLLSSPLHSLHPILGWVCEHWTMYVCCGLENSIAGCKADRRVSSGGRRCYRLVWAAMGVCVGDGREALNRGLPPLALHAIPSPIHPQSSRQGSARATQGEKSVPNFVARPGRGWGKTFPGWHLGTASGSCLLRGLFCN